MDRQTGPTMGPDGLFTDGDPANGLQGSQPRSGWANGVTEELRNLIIAAGLTPDFTDYEQVTQAVRELASEQAGASRNQLINGGMDLWQRRPSDVLGSTETYVADRWAIRGDFPGGTGLANIQRTLFLDGQQDVEGTPEYYLRFSQTSPATAGTPTLVQRIEGVRRLSGGKVTVSAYLRCNNTLEVLPTLTQKFGPGGSNSVTAGQASWTISTAWQRYSFTADVESVAGKSIGLGSNLELMFVLPQGNVFQLDVAQVQVEASATPLAFEQRPLMLELLLAQRFYEKSYPIDTLPGSQNRAGATRGYDEGNAFVALNTRFRVTKRTIPAVTFLSPQGGQAGRIEVNNQVYPVTAILDPSTESTGAPQIGTVITPATNCIAHWVADAEL